ncbi:hypothetical protein Btru_061232 [Bulinus truncatus]|nr:hypothetical protein Btru_061232 [Bulinus truncatus]
MSKSNVDGGEALPSALLCDMGWEMAGNSCVYISEEEQSWSDANLTCDKRQSQLADINSKNFYLESIVKYDADCGMMWKRRPGTDLCYQFRETKMPWFQALEHCTYYKGSLASITSSEEQKYIEGKLSEMDILQFWIGASDRREMYNFQWEDGAPYIYFNWDEGQPRFENIPNCVGISADSMGWKDYSCYLSNAFICKKKANPRQFQTDTTSTTVVTPSLRYYGCPPGWLNYGAHCYQIITKTKPSRFTNEDCLAQKSYIASIHSKEENDFLWSHLSQDKKYRIGFIWEKNKSGIMWVDNTAVNYTNWAYMPTYANKSFEMLFVQIEQKSGKWISNNYLDQGDGYICKKPADVVTSTPIVQKHSVGCLENGYAYAEYCYTYYGNMTSWDEALSFCRDRNGNLATVTNSVVNDFVSSVSGGDRNSPFWIGLSLNRRNRIWSSGITPNEEFWDKDFTGNDDGCTAIKSKVQLWQLQDCRNLLPFVCETVREGFTTSAVPSTTTSSASKFADCPPTWIRIMECAIK